MLEEYTTCILSMEVTVEAMKVKALDDSGVWALRVIAAVIIAYIVGMNITKARAVLGQYSGLEKTVLAITTLLLFGDNILMSCLRIEDN